METISCGTLEPWWITGLADGEGSFTYNRSGKQMAVVFQIKMTACERPVLERIQAFFNIGKIYDVRARSPTSNAGATKTACMYRVGRHDELPRILEHFARYPLQSYKAEAYKIWRAMAEIKTLYRVRNHEILEELAMQLSELQVKNQTWR